MNGKQLSQNHDLINSLKREDDVPTTNPALSNPAMQWLLGFPLFNWVPKYFTSVNPLTAASKLPISYGLNSIDGVSKSNSSSSVSLASAIINGKGKLWFLKLLLSLMSENVAEVPCRSLPAGKSWYERPLPQASVVVVLKPALFLAAKSYSMPAWLLTTQLFKWLYTPSRSSKRTGHAMESKSVVLAN